MATAYDNWKTQTPEDTDEEEQDRIDAAKARIERKIDGLEDIMEGEQDYE